MIKLYGIKFTPTEFAKKYVYEHGYQADDWLEDLDSEVTATEENLIIKAIDLQLFRVHKFLGMEKINNKLHGK